MKLLIAIVQPTDAQRVSDRLRDDGYRFTQLTSLGGFLETPNVTLILAAEEGAVPAALDAFRETCSGRDVEIPLVLTERLADWKERVAHYAGATIFVLDLAEFIRL